MVDDQEKEMSVFAPFVERRSNNDQALYFLLETVHNKIDALDQKLTIHIHDETLMLAEEIAKLMVKAFPYGDPDSHRAEHEANRKIIEEKAKFWTTMKTELARWGLIGFCGICLVALWKYILAGPK